MAALSFEVMIKRHVHEFVIISYQRRDVEAEPFEEAAISQNSGKLRAQQRRVIDEAWLGVGHYFADELQRINCACFCLIVLVVLQPLFRDSAL